MTTATPAGPRPRPADDDFHPRPQLRRPWLDLTGPWQFAFDDDVVGVHERWPTRSDVFDRTIVVPYPFESADSGIGDTGYHPVVWYRREVDLTRRPGERVLLNFGAVDYRAHVFVNSVAVAYHEGGHASFTADVTAALEDRGPQVVVLRAEDAPMDLRQPRGKQDWQPEQHAIWYDRTSGIWQPVWVEHVPEARIRSLRWRPDVERRGLDLTVRLRTEGRPLRLRVVLRSGDEVLADDTYAAGHGEVQRRITLVESDMSLGHSALLWSPEAPTLLDATVSLLDEDGAVVDEVLSYTALRSIRASRDRVLLNGRPYFLRLALAQNFWPTSHLAAPGEEALREEVELAKSLGFNGIRLHQKVEDPRFLAWCDRLGLLVWAEMPSAYEFSTQTIDRLTREWLEVLERDCSHPCIVAWVPVNESWGVPSLETSPQQQDLVRALYHLTKSMDPDRLCIGNDGWEQPVTDVVTVHDYASRGAVLRERYGDRRRLDETLTNTQPGYRLVLLPGVERQEAPVVLSEFGGISLDLDVEPDRRAGWGGYGSVRTPEQLLEGYADLVGALVESTAVVGFCWTQLTDTGLERNGLLTADRRPKVDPARIRAVTTRVAASVPGDAVNDMAYGSG